MSIKALQSLSEMTKEELVLNIKALKKEKLGLNFLRSSGGSINTSRIKGIRRQIARIKTLLSKKE